MKYLLYAILSISLCSCGLLETFDRKTDRVEVVITVQESISNRSKGTRGYSITRNGKCYVYILEEWYPYLLDHEIRHCFEGHWHGDSRNIEHDWIKWK